MKNQTVQEGKTIAIISYITVIGTLIAFIMNQNKQNYFASFHIRQAIGIFVLGLLVNFLQRYTDFGWLDMLLGIGVFILWIIGLIGAIQGEEKRVPLLGDQFQEWFRNIH
ncbi:hypothetical protein [Lutimonas vermicola]|uniref:Chloroplast import component protein (Tic20) n=1 Tax=Lutimonas vermicola TaxID=414288 RepID=A0ABU9KWD1_9FLAO